MAELVTPTPEQMTALQLALHPLIGVQLELLNIPREALIGFEPSQIGSIVGALKEEEKKDLNEDTNFGKLNRIPYEPLRQFLMRYGYKPLASRIRQVGAVTLAVDETAEGLPGEL